MMEIKKVCVIGMGTMGSQIGVVCAKEAEAMGWINKAVPPGELEKETETWAMELVAKSPTALALGKKMHNAYYDLLSSSAEMGVEMLTFFWETREAIEGMLAFKEKREPVFKP